MKPCKEFVFLGRQVFLWEDLGAFWGKIKIGEDSLVEGGPYGSLIWAIICSQTKILEQLSELESNPCQIIYNQGIIYQNLASIEKFGSLIYEPIEPLLPPNNQEFWRKGIAGDNPSFSDCFEMKLHQKCLRTIYKANVFNLPNSESLIYLQIYEEFLPVPASQLNHPLYLDTSPFHQQ